jgi:hypothetical protein
MKNSYQMLIKAKTNLFKLLICLMPNLIYAVSEQPPVNDIMIRTLSGEVKTGTRCAAFDDSMQALMLSPDDVIKWRSTTPARTTEITIPVAFHIVKDNNKGDISDERITQQIDVLNKAYSKLNIKFTIHSIERINNSLYYNLNLGLREFFMKLQYSINPTKVFNVYTLEPSGGVLGWATFPWQYPENSFLHGVVLLNESFPGGNTKDYSLGHTLVHEAGHYLGLYHTFQGGCMSPGDSVDDTPYHADANYGCPIGNDSCTSAGLDPVENYMNYTDDACMNSFSKGQIDRIDWAISNYKTGFIN